MDILPVMLLDAKVYSVSFLSPGLGLLRRVRPRQTVAHT